MAKYSTGGASRGSDARTCELCGTAAENLRTANVAGAELQVCPDCAPHDDAGSTGGGGGTGGRGGSPGGSGGSRGTDRKRRAARNVARASDSLKGDSSHWEEEGTNYDSDPLPYLVSDYGDRVTAARQDAGLQLDELAEELGVPETDLLAVEQGRATRASVGGSVVTALEDRLDVELVAEER